MSTFASPSGEWILTVTRLHRTWNGRAELVMARNGAEVWRREHDLGMREAGVDDAGRVAGFGYTGKTVLEFPFSHVPGARRGEVLRIFVLDPTGDLVLDELHFRRDPPNAEGPCSPLVNRLFLQPELHRFVVRIYDEIPSRSAEQWWGYDVRTGNLLFRERPKLELDVPGPLRSITDARPVPDTPLVLVQWWHVDSTHDAVLLGSVYQLLDADRRIVWSFDAIRTHARDRDHFTSGGAGASLGPASFELSTATPGERARFAVKNEGGVWNVVEVERVAPGARPR